MKTPSGKSKQKSVKPLQASLLFKAKELKYNLDTRTAGIKARNKKVVSKTFHKAGIVVPLDANDVGYRPLTVTDGEWLILDSTYFGNQGLWDFYYFIGLLVKLIFPRFSSVTCILSFH